jgi:uncharacterized Rmd1/YagE family protein
MFSFYNREIFTYFNFYRLRRLLGVRSLDEIVDMPKVKGQHIHHNLTHLNKTGVVTNLRKEEQLPHWILSAMRCLAYCKFFDWALDKLLQKVPHNHNLREYYDIKKTSRLHIALSFLQLLKPVFWLNNK